MNPGDAVSKSKFSPLDADLEKRVSDWLENYVNAPHPDLGRDGPICPFIEPALRADSLFTVSRDWEGAYTLEAMVTAIEEAQDHFRSIDWPSRNTTLHGLVVVFGNLPRAGWWLIDEGHRAAKDAAVARGLMLGQFHPECEAPAARNPLFPVNRSPYPMIAIRNMAFHDILFLHDNPDWFEQYRKRYDRYYSAAARIDPRFTALFEEAVAASRSGQAAHQETAEHHG
uniref:DUF6875 domain-containing protein n=1 Tax=Streptomyces olivaceus TaxID=47716 RepID=A0A3G8G7J8_STROV|nr:hypothetical protein [Streptomyces olivaceus]